MRDHPNGRTPRGGAGWMVVRHGAVAGGPARPMRRSPMAQRAITPVPTARRGTVVTPLTAEVRVARGRAARAVSPRSSLGQFEPRPDRPDPIGLLEQQGESRVAELVPIRYGRMLVSPFAFFRGAALIMASDLSSTPTSGLR